ncbi:MAG TPA: DNA polymerase III subunit delta [Clostridiales bacterium]|nr:DNA polymerase III subunit delta [Clostridiales bacterium]
MNYKELKNNVKKDNLYNFIVLYGDEVFLIDDAIRNITNKYLSQDFKEMNYTKFEKIEDSFNEFYETVTTFPFMSDKKVIVVNESDFMTSTGSLNKAYEDKLISLLSSESSTSIVIFVLKNKKPDTRKKMVKIFKDNNSIYEIKKLEEGELINWIVEGFKAKGLKINPSNANYIALNCGYLDYESVVNLYDINNEIDKIYSYAMDNGEVTREDIDLLLTKSLDSNIFKLVDYICEGKKDKASLMLEDMLQNGAAEQFIIHMIARQYRMIYEYQILAKRGYSMNEIMDAMKIKKFIASKLSNIVRNITIEKTEYIIEQLLDIDRKIKTGLIDKNVGLDIICNSF